MADKEIVKDYKEIKNSRGLESWMDFLDCEPFAEEVALTDNCNILNAHIDDSPSYQHECNMLNTKAKKLINRNQ